ncbi:hypothetical protein NDU88_002749 [Pleurodeles waltl]|uniref:Uncharacterized protein n=1 Tax=Pleurodeles waltl TaxID=8319 RepID=A0AAV7TMR0_PLEWA|nr:hypothetical protein NDU88_002749 [Pleurodeles waltl]
MGTPPTLGGHPQLSLRHLLAPAANVLPSFPAVGAPSLVDPQGSDVLGDGTPNVLLLVGADLHDMHRGRRGVISKSTVEVPFLQEDGPDGGVVAAVEPVEPVDSDEEDAEEEDIDNRESVIRQYFQ